MTAGARLFAGVDIGGTSTEAVVTDADNRVRAQVAHVTRTATSDELLETTTEAIREAVAAAAAEGDIAAIGVGVPGQVDVDSGVVRLAINLNLDGQGFPIGPRIEERFGVLTTVENDVRAAALGAYDHLSQSIEGIGCLAYVSIGTGISAGLVVDGRLHRGRDGMAGEIGHVTVVDGGPPCVCGLEGCLEVVAAGPAIARLWPGGQDRPAQAVFEAAAEGDPEAVRVAGIVAGHLTRAVHWLTLAYGADLVVLGGGVGSIGGPLLSAIRGRLADLGSRSALMRRMLPPERVVAMPTGFPTGAVGAAALARRRLGARKEAGAE